jgi:hypothetical protein
MDDILVHEFPVHDLGFSLYQALAFHRVLLIPYVSKVPPFVLHWWYLGGT